MKTSGTWGFRSIVVKMMMGLVLAAMIGSIDVVTVLGKDDHERMGKYDNGRIMDKIMMGLVLAAMKGNIDVVPALGKDDHEPMGKHDNGRYEHRGHNRYDRDRYMQGRRVYRSYGYRERVYTPPRVIYAPSPPPGIGIFFPPVFIHT